MQNYSSPEATNGFGQRLRVLRTFRGLSQREVAQAMGVSLWRYWRIEREVSLPRPEELERLTAVLAAAETR